ncbi:MAG: AAA family ATPase [Bacteroidota bacterium]
MWKFPFYEIDQPIDWSAMELKFDWFADMRGVQQDPVWHAEGDVFTHTKMVVEALVDLPEFESLSEQEKHILFAAAMLHDVEKRSTTQIEIIDGKERIVSPRHAKKGEITTRNLLYEQFQVPFAIREQIAKLVRLHGLPLWAIGKDDPRKAVIESSLSVNNKLLAMLATADVLGRICDDQEEILLKIALFKELCLENDCYEKPKTFSSDYGKFLYLNKRDISPDYDPFDDLKFEVIMMCALPGIGKDTYISRNLDLPVLSLDEIRRENKIDPTDKKGNGRVIQIGKERAREYMRKQTSFVFNATNISSDVRSKWISLFLEYRAKVKIIYLEVPYKQMMSQNRNREYIVPDKVIDKMRYKLELPGFSEAHQVEFVVKE